MRSKLTLSAKYKFMFKELIEPLLWTFATIFAMLRALYQATNTNEYKDIRMIQKYGYFIAFYYAVLTGQRKWYWWFIIIMLSLLSFEACLSWV